MQCSFCSEKAIYYAKHFGKFFCARHLERYLIRRTKREIYKHHLINPHDSLLFLSDFSPASEGALFIFSQILKRWPVKLFAVAKNEFENVEKWKGEKISKIVDPCMLECETTRILFALANSRIYPAGYSYARVIRPFRAFPAKSFATIAIWKGLKYEKRGKSKIITKYAGEGLMLNFLRGFDKIVEVLRQQQSKKQREGKRRQKS